VTIVTRSTHPSGHRPTWLHEVQAENSKSLAIQISTESLFGLLFCTVVPVRSLRLSSSPPVWYPGQPGGRFALIHTDDLADLYVRAVEKAAICGGLIFGAANDQTESVDDVLATFVKVSGAYEYRNPSNGMFPF
jgi:hypothetical protein